MHKKKLVKFYHHWLDSGFSSVMISVCTLSGSTFFGRLKFTTDLKWHEPSLKILVKWSVPCVAHGCTWILLPCPLFTKWVAAGISGLKLPNPHFPALSKAFTPSCERNYSPFPHKTKHCKTVAISTTDVQARYIL